MSIKKSLFVFIAFLCSFSVLHSQLTEHYFSDNETKAGGKIYDHINDGPNIIIGGTSFDNYPGQPSVSKIDTLGNIIWTTTSKDFSVYSQANIYKIFLSGDFIYALNIIDVGDKRELWKIDAGSGDIIWKNEFYDKYFYLPQHFFDYDDDKFLIGYFEKGGKNKYAYIDKMNGDTISTHMMGNGYTGLKYGLAIDSDLNIYYTHKDSIFKAGGFGSNDILWRNALPEDSDIVDYLNVYVDDNDSIFLFARYDNFFSSSGEGKIVAINSVDGSLLWETGATDKEIAHVSFIDKNGFLYSTWRHAFVGGTNSKYWTTKIDKSTGQIAWNTAPDFGNGQEGAISMSLDDDSNVYLTGYYSAANYGPADWGIAKIDGNSGNTLFIQKATNGHDESSGIGISIIDNQLFVVGNYENVQVGPALSTPTLFKVDAANGNILKRNFIGHSYQFPSKTILLENYGSDKTVALKQVGRKTVVEMYDNGQNLLWEWSDLRNYMLIGSHLTVDDENGNIILTAYDVRNSNNEPYYNNTAKDAYVFIFNESGFLLNEYSFPLNVGNPFPFEIMIDGDRFFIFYRKNNYLYGRTIDSNGLSEEESVIPAYNNTLSPTSHIINHADTSFFIFSKSAIKEMDKNTFDKITSTYIYFAEQINHVAKTPANDALLCGSDKTENDLLVKFDLQTSDTTWTRTYDTNSNIFKFVFDADSSNIFTLGVQSSNIVVRKISAQDGTLEWTNLFEVPPSMEGVPVDIIFDQTTEQLAITGYIETLTNKKLFINFIDSSGATVQSYFNDGDYEGENIGLCLEKAPDGSTRVGGQLNHSLYGKAGFIYNIAENGIENRISGYTYFDENENGIKDGAEKDLSFFKVTLQPIGASQFTNATGKFIYFLNAGSYALSPDPIPNWQLTSDSSIYHINLDSIAQIENLNFGFTPTIDTTDLIVAVGSGLTRCDNFVKFKVDVNNNGTTITDGTLWMEVDPLIQNTEFNISPDTIINQSLFGWHFENLYPSEFFSRDVSLEMPGINDGIDLGDHIYVEAFAVTSDFEQDTFDFNYSSEIRCAFDPNDKLVKPSRGQDNYTLFEEALIYTIRFQNTGTDTAFNITIRDTLDTNLDVNSLKIISSSHFELLKTTLTGQYLEFNFENIMLPDSNVNYDGSQGYVMYRIDAIEGLAENTPIQNKAGIYFDNNPPVITNQTINTMVSELPTTSLPSEIENVAKNKIQFYPNPSNGDFSIKMELQSFENDIAIEIYDNLGRAIEKKYFSNYRGKYFNQQISLNETMNGLAVLKININGDVYSYYLFINSK